MNKIIIYILLSLFFSLWSCSSRKTDDVTEHIRKLDNLEEYQIDGEPVYKIKFERTVSYGSTNDVFVLVGGSSGELARVDKNGRVYIPDRQQNTIHVFESDGRYLTSMGKRGRGPGEFILISTIRIGSNQLYVSDSNLKRINVLSLDSLAFSHTVKLDRDNWKQVSELNDLRLTEKFFVRENGTVLVRFSSFILPGNPAMWDNPEILEMSQYRYYMMDQNGKVISDEILKQKQQRWTLITNHRGPQVLTLPIYGKPLIAVSDDRIFSARSEDFLIKVYDLNGKYLRSFYYPYTKSTLNRNDLIKRYELLDGSPHLKAAKTLELPETWPALSSILVDENNRLWVSTIVDDHDVYEWWVLDEYGKLLAKFDWPRDQSIEEIRNNSIYVRETNEMEEATIVKYRIIISEI